MIELRGQLLNVLRDVRVAQFAVDGRGVIKLSLDRQQTTELEGGVGKRFVIRVEEEAEVNS